MVCLMMILLWETLRERILINNIASEGSPDGTGINESQDNNSAATTRANGAVAKINDVEYNTLDEAIKEASDGAIIELLGNAEHRRSELRGKI